MLDSLKQSGNYVGRKIGKSWKDLPEGWCKLLYQSNNVLAHLSSRNNDGQTQRQR